MQQEKLLQDVFQIAILCYSVLTKTFSGGYYYMTFIDLMIFIIFTEERLLKHKSKASKYLKFFLKYNPTVKKIRCENDKEYLTKDLVILSRYLVIVIDPTPPYTSSLNGVAAVCSWI